MSVPAPNVKCSAPRVLTSVFVGRSQWKGAELRRSPATNSNLKNASAESQGGHHGRAGVITIASPDQGKRTLSPTFQMCSGPYPASVASCLKLTADQNGPWSSPDRAAVAR